MKIRIYGRYQVKIIMLSKVKTIFLLAIIPMFFGVMIGMSINTSEAQMLKPTNPEIQRLSPKSFGTATAGIVCGAELCNQPEPVIDIEENDQVIVSDTYPEYMPTLTLNSINKFRPSTQNQAAITHTIAYSMTAGEMNLENIQIEVSSDIEEEDYQVGSLTSMKTSKNTARIKALDADSIVIEVTGFTIAPPTGDPRRG